MGDQVPVLVYREPGGQRNAAQLALEVPALSLLREAERGMKTASSALRSNFETSVLGFSSEEVQVVW